MAQQDSTPRPSLRGIVSTAKALEQLTTLSDGLLLVSESDHPFHVVNLGVISDSELPSVIRTAASRPDAGVQNVPLDTFFERATRAQPHHTNAERIVVERYRALVRFLSSELATPRVYRVGKIEVDVFALGRSLEGEWLGVATKLVET